MAQAALGQGLRPGAENGDGSNQAPASAPASSSGGDDSGFTLINKTKTVVTALYLVPAGTRGWGENILPRKRLARGAKVDIPVRTDRGVCKWNLKAEFADGDEVVDKAVDFCEIGEYSLTE